MRGPVSNESAPAVWHRIQDTVYASLCEEFGYSDGEGTLRVEHFTYRVLRETRCGVWIDWGFGKGRFVRRDTKKQFASPTFELALEKFKRRKERQIAILKHQLNRAKRALEASNYVKPRTS